MRLDSKVTEWDVEEAIRLMRVATQAAATDPRTGTIDMDMITSGRTQVDRDLVQRLAEQLRQFFSSRKGSRMQISQIRAQLSQDSGMQLSMNDVEQAVKDILESDDNNGIKYIPNTQTVIVTQGGAL